MIEDIKKQLIENLNKYGIVWNDALQRLEVSDDRATQRKLAELTNKKGERYYKSIRNYFAQVGEVNIDKIEPYLVEVQNNTANKIWSYCTSLWSVPVSAGYGRRIRFLVFDRQNSKIIGLFGLCDPLIGFKKRDEHIGWSREQKNERLYNCLTAYVLGAIPPYNQLFGAKLVALTTLFPEVQEAFKRKYEGVETIISKKQKMPVLAMIDTFGAFGRSAIYTKLLNWKFLGYTQGKTHIHITANENWELIKSLADKNILNGYGYGKGSNWKMRVVRSALAKLGFINEDILTIGWQRGYYICPLISNYKEFLCMQTDTPEFINHSKNDLISYWRNRWLAKIKTPTH